LSVSHMEQAYLDTWVGKTTCHWSREENRTSRPASGDTSMYWFLSNILGSDPFWNNLKHPPSSSFQSSFK
jgi:hypothetical protein